MSKSYATRRQQRPEDGGPRFGQRPFAPPRPRVVQAYSILKPQEVAQDTSFTSQDIKRGRYSGAYRQSVTTPVAEPESEETSFKTVSQELRTGRQEESFGGVPELKVSENRTLAINHVAAHPKEFFAEPDVVEANNTKLAKIGSGVRLRTGAGTIKLPGNDTRLVKVEPGTPSQVVNGAIDPLVSMAFDECNRVIGQVVGSAKRVVALAGGKVEIPAGQQGMPPNDPMLDYLVRNPDAPTEEGARTHAAAFQPSQANPEPTAKAYRALSAEKRRAQAETLGLNQYAQPEVGEGYVIKSEYTHEFIQGTRAQLNPQDYLRAIQELRNIEPGHDVTSQEQVVDETVRGMMDVWMVHYAGVVARDGGDTVTLENYNRTPENDWEIRRIFNHLFEQFAAFRDHIAHKEEEVALNLNYDTAQAKDLIAEFNEVLGLAEQGGQEIDAQLRQAVQEAQDSVTTGLRNDNALANSLIYFQMYGQGDQSFHSVFKGMASNPTTYRTRASVKEDIASRIEARRRVYANLLGAANLGHGGATAELSILENAMTVYIASAAAAIREEATDDDAQRLAATLANDRSTIFADPKLARQLYKSYCAITGQQPGDLPANRAALVVLIDGKLGSFWTGSQTKTSLRALKVLVNALPAHLAW